MQNILVSGSKSGLGRYCCEKLQAQGLHRGSHWQDMGRDGKVLDAIVHCAWNTDTNTMKNNFQQYLADTLILTEKLLALPAHRFVFISTIDVYPQDHTTVYKEDDIIDISQIKTVYGQIKYLTEQYIQSKIPQSLIIRPSALLGPYSRPNSLIKLLTYEQPVLSLASQSTFNYVLHADLVKFIQYALERELTGIYNFVAKDNITLQEVADHHQKIASFGEYEYQTQNINSDKINVLIPECLKTSAQVIQEFIKNMNQAKVES